MKKLLLFILSIISFSAETNLYSQLIWSTYCSAGTSDATNKVDKSGNSYIAHSSNFLSYPITAGAYDTSYNGPLDIVITKMNQTGSALIYSTFLGGDSSEYYEGMALDSMNNVLITGFTYSRDFPVTSGAFDTSYNLIYNDSYIDGFVTKLNPNGTALVFSSFIGGSRNDRSTSVDIDKENNIYVFGITYSEDFPITTGAYKKDGNGLFLSKINSNGSSLIYSTMLFLDSLNQVHYNQLKIDSLGNSYIAGTTSIEKLPTTPNSYCPNKPFGGVANYVLKINATGTAILFSTYINIIFPGSTVISLNKSCEPYITGTTNLNTYPETPGAYDTDFNGIYDIYITKLDKTGSTLSYSSFLGGSNRDYSSSIAIDDKSNIYLTGATVSDDFPITKNAYASSRANHSLDAIIAVLNSDGNELIYSTFFGGSLIDDGYCIDFDRYYYAYFSGETISSDFPTTPKVFDSVYSGDMWLSYNNYFIAKFKVFSGDPRIESVNKMEFPGSSCLYVFQDTFYLKNTGTSSLKIDSASFRGIDSSLFSISSEQMPFPVYQGDSSQIIINFHPKDSTGARAAALYIYNNTSINPWIINLSANYDTIAFKVDNVESDTLIIDIGSYCPNSKTIDTVITLFNKSSIGTTFKIEKPDNSAFQISPIGKAYKKAADTPQAIKKK